MNAYHGASGMDCRDIAPAGFCFTVENCQYFEGFGAGEGEGDSGPAGMVIFNSIVSINSASFDTLCSNEILMEKRGTRTCD